MNKSSNSGIGFCGLLAIVFITLKLTHFVDWGWGWVLSPIWIPLCIALSALISYLCVIIWCSRKR